MSAPDGLYERAAPDGMLRPFWHVDEVHTFFVGPLEYNRLHQHGAPVFLAGIYSEFRLRIHGGHCIRAVRRSFPLVYFTSLISAAIRWPYFTSNQSMAASKYLYRCPAIFGKWTALLWGAVARFPSCASCGRIVPPPDGPVWLWRTCSPFPHDGPLKTETRE